MSFPQKKIFYIFALAYSLSIKRVIGKLKVDILSVFILTKKTLFVNDFMERITFHLSQ